MASGRIFEEKGTFNITYIFQYVFLVKSIFLTSRLMASLGSCGIVESNALSQPREIANVNMKIQFRIT
jgi:hypothetical protein